MNSECERQVVILMATYNGQEYLREQIESIIGQTYTNWVLVIRDDGSTDDTVSIIRDYVKNNPSIEVLETARAGERSPVNNFRILLGHAVMQFEENTIFMFSDQDDIWLDDKLEKSVKCLQEAENSSDGAPAMVFADLSILFNDEHEITCSFNEVMNYDHPEGWKLKNILTRNVVTGSTMAFNYPAAVRANPIPGSAYMHDWWVAQCVVSLGVVRYIPEVLVKYRQHDANVVGYETYLTARDGKLSAMARIWRKGQDILQKSIVQAADLLDRIGADLPTDSYNVIRDYSRLSGHAAFKRVFIYYSSGYGSTYWVNRVGTAIRLIFL